MFSAILDTFYTEVDCIRRAAKGVGGGGPGRRVRWCSKIEKEGIGMNLAKFWAIQISKLAKMKSRGTYSTPQSCTPT